MASPNSKQSILPEMFAAPMRNSIFDVTVQRIYRQHIESKQILL